MDVDQLGAIEAIRQLKARYFRLMDEKRWDEWADVFTDDAVIVTTDDAPGMEPIIGGAAFVAFLSPILEGVITCHHGHMPEIELLSHDRARGIWAMFDRVDHPARGRQGGAGQGAV